MKNNADKGKIHSTESFGAVDGPGIRYVIFFQGCPLRCVYCHNPDTWNRAEGQERSVEEIVEEILPYRPFLRNGGVTLTGGEPLLQPEFAASLLQQLKRKGFHTAVDTSGSIPLEICRDAVNTADLILLDIKALDPTLCKALTRKDNTNALDLLEYCEKMKKPVWIRHVLVPGYTLDFPRLVKLAEYLKPFRCVEKVELLPFHQLGRYKWDICGLDYQLSDTPEPAVNDVNKARKIFESAGLSVH